ncbi:MAG: hypothetical protein JWN70_2202 [Planctomycetaceae bacterium]|nr:hypothetical protein [Planctomycetaceae bacterium]
MKPAGDVTPNSVRSRDSRKRQGVFYTPDPVARYMVAATFHRWQAAGQSLATLRVLDPACGEGALLWPAYQHLCRQLTASDGPTRLDIIQWQLFGVDLDGEALERLRERFRTDLTGQVSTSDLERVLNANFRCGNAVAGHGWETPDTSSPPTENTIFHWSQQFPEICAAGGFDIVLANPPYRRERGAKLDLAGLEHAPLSDCWRQARMDLWHYFFHRSLDLLRPGGLLTFIVNSYWTTSAAGRPLIQRLAEEATPLEFVDLETAPVFASVGGRHLIMQVRKGVTSEPCDVFRLQPAFHSGVGDPGLWTDLFDRRRASAGELENVPFTYHQIARDDLLQDGRIWLNPRPALRSPSGAAASQGSLRLGDLFEVRQGIAENPPRVTRKQALEQPEYRAGEGVFVLTTDELRQLNLSAAEERCVRPYYSAAEITRDWSPSESTHWLLYLNRDTAPDISLLPNIARHLSRFRPLLERRRETLQGKIPWWHLHWPRESRLFEEPRILAVQMCREPLFAYVETPTYVGFSVNLIVSKPSSAERRLFNDLSLPALAAVLNSQWASEWFGTHAKRRGVNLDITGSTLKDFPIPDSLIEGNESR